MSAITARGLANTLRRRIARRIEMRLLQWSIDGYEHDLELLHEEAANNREARRLIEREQLQRKARLNDLKR